MRYGALAAGVGIAAVLAAVVINFAFFHIKAVECARPLLWPRAASLCAQLYGRTAQYSQCASALGATAYQSHLWMNSHNDSADLFLHYTPVFAEHCLQQHAELMQNWVKQGYETLELTYIPNRSRALVPVVLLPL